MRSDWLAASSFERTQEVLSAINALSIHAKLTQAGLPDADRAGEIRQARERLLAFLKDITDLVQEAEGQDQGTFVGADPRMGELAAQFLSSRRRPAQRPSLYTMPLPDIEELIRSDHPQDLPKLVDCLRDLRALLERHAHADFVGMLGDSER